MKITPRHVEILSAIDYRVNRALRGNGFWLPGGVPRGTNDWSEHFHKFINIQGPDGNRLRALERNGYLVRPKTNLSERYCYVLTNKGKRTLQKAIA